MEETLKKLDELALELKLLTTEMREKGPRYMLLLNLQGRVDAIQALLNATERETK